MSSSTDTEQRFIDLEIKIGFMEDLLDNLNTLVARQQQHIDLLVKEVSALRRQQDDGGVGLLAPDALDHPPITDLLIAADSLRAGDGRGATALLHVEVNLLRDTAPHPERPPTTAFRTRGCNP